MATYNFELNSKPTRRGTYAILLRITVNKKHKRLKTEVEVNNPAHFNPRALANQSKEDDVPQYITMGTDRKKKNTELYDFLQSVKATAKELKKEGNAATSQSIATRIKDGDRTHSFIIFAEEYAKRTLEAGNYRTYTKYITFLNKLKYFVNRVKPEALLAIPHKGEEYEEFMQKMKKDLLFSEITLSFLNKFKAYLQRIPNTKNTELTLHPNTISKQFDVFKSLFNKGRIELREEGLLLKENPFDDFQCETIDTNKEKLTEEEIERLKALELEEGSLLWHTRNCFILAYYCAGMRAGDLIQLRGTNITYVNGSWRVNYRMDKTASAKIVLLIPDALDILAKYMDIHHRTSNYIFPLLDNHAAYAKATTWEEKEQLPYEVKRNLLQQVNSKNSLLNKNLNTLASMAGIEKKVSMHIARHSFADTARRKDANVYDISKALGHSSLKITETYMSKFDTSSQDATMKKVFGGGTQREELMKQLQALNEDELMKLIQQLRGGNEP